MIHSKNKSAFSLIEAMLAIAIIGLVLTPMFILEQNVFTGVIRLAQKFQRMVFAQNFLYEAQRKEPVGSVKYSLERKEESPISAVRYSLDSIDKRSSLSSIKRLYRQKVDASGLAKDSSKATLVQFVCRPERPS